MGVWRYGLIGLFLTLVLLGVQMGHAQEGPEAFAFGNVLGSVQESVSDKAQLAYDDRRAQEQYKLYQSSIITTALIISLTLVLIFCTKMSFAAVNIMNICALILIVFATMFIAILSDTDEQLTASMGILGAIAGYLFGTMRSAQGEEGRKEEAPTE
ncbi:MAG: hypothetical protein ACE5GK_02015 [Nitrospiria bacterium]